VDLFQGYDWPVTFGNAELVERAVVLCEGDDILCRSKLARASVLKSDVPQFRTCRRFPWSQTLRNGRERQSKTHCARLKADLGSDRRCGETRHTQQPLESKIRKLGSTGIASERRSPRLAFRPYFD